MVKDNCPTREQLYECAVGTLTEDQIESILDHVGSCPDCQASLTTIDQSADTLISRLRHPAREEAFADEPQRQAAFDRAKALVGEAIPVGADRAGGLSEDSDSSSEEPAELGELGEYQSAYFSAYLLFALIC